jgi:outer membrane protein assembly factor BamE (lipoprotein component of BamABCDE complex)
MATVFSMSEPVRSRSDPNWLKSVVTGSILALVLIGGVPTVRNLIRRKPRQPYWTAGDSLESLRASILGHGRKQIAAKLGPPKALGNGAGITWYYALDHEQRIAMAIQFDHDQARAVEFFQSPG